MISNSFIKNKPWSPIRIILVAVLLGLLLWIADSLIHYFEFSSHLKMMIVERSESFADSLILIYDGKFEYVNPRLCEIGGYTFEEVIGTHIIQYVVKSEIPKVVDYYERRRRDSAVNIHKSS